MANKLGIDCGSISLNLALLLEGDERPVTIYRRTRGRPLATFVETSDELIEKLGEDLPITGAMVTGSARELISRSLEIPAINEITAHATGVHHVAPAGSDHYRNWRTRLQIHENRTFSVPQPASSFGVPHERDLRRGHRSVS